MATVQSSKVAQQYNQHYIPVNSNPIPGVIAVGPAAVQPDGQYTAVTQMQQQHQHQERQSVPIKPIILNHMVGGPSVSGNQLSSFCKLDQQPAPPAPSPSNLLLLVEWDMPPGEPNAYSIIDSSELVLQGGNTRETIHTGKNILVRRGKKIQQATVVIISDDKQFIETELKQLRKMAAENLYRNMATSSLGHSVDQNVKRRRVEPTTACSNEMEPASPDYEPMPTPSHIATANWVNSCKPDRVISPSPSVMTMHLSTPKAPPMTFHQQTQTDCRFFPQEPSRSSQPELARLVSLQESILAEQKSVRMENEYNRKMMYDIIEQLNSFSETLKHLVSKVDSVQKYEITEMVKEDPVSNVSSYVVLGTGEEESRDRLSSATESVIPRPPPSNENSNNLMIDQISLHEDSNMSFGQTKFSVPEDTSSATSTPKNLNFSNRLSASALSLSNASMHSQSSNTLNQSKSIVNDVLKDWNDEDSDDSEMTPIGPNNTMVKKQVLRAINWTSYKAATRKLLMTLFSRSMLASHTLTGRPSPAFMGDRAKPLKDKLDQRIIADIIAIVTKSCNVTESMVRTAITTKCADENKMNRMKNSKVSSQTVMTQYVKDPYVVPQPQQNSPQVSTAEIAVPVHSRRIKRENKENVH
ncbi:uncharacterized protein LOC131678248 [Topomyia yanbarensis]|uniref:uncharacterized protein LOC131678248 n=1 Tax=Topomyia yanbarensis TaxID=2498891 RepID=UPI00273AEC7D|nr:uncharacterized protein LOC131678248 [Topomyia yanbarensis]XP_058814237.1 uncharacterized protein LOC131678248 [Topomyia yanbarensis]XP_058814238.1 uncharacterized protein LOC131678248 [Topomyia yanbarensis]